MAGSAQDEVDYCINQEIMAYENRLQENLRAYQQEQEYSYRFWSNILQGQQKEERGSK